jgi:hypothetical protein
MTRRSVRTLSPLGTLCLLAACEVDPEHGADAAIVAVQVSADAAPPHDGGATNPATSPAADAAGVVHTGPEFPSVADASVEAGAVQTAVDAGMDGAAPARDAAVDDAVASNVVSDARADAHPSAGDAGPAQQVCLLATDRDLPEPRPGGRCPPEVCRPDRESRQIHSSSATLHCDASDSSSRCSEAMTRALMAQEMEDLGKVTSLYETKYVLEHDDLHLTMTFNWQVLVDSSLDSLRAHFVVGSGWKGTQKDFVNLQCEPANTHFLSADQGMLRFTTECTAWRATRVLDVDPYITVTTEIPTIRTWINCGYNLPFEMAEWARGPQIALDVAVPWTIAH